MPLSPGASFGSYRVDVRIGAGGMGEVYRATDTRLGRIVALKVLAPRHADHPEFDARFEREARVLASLNHPNIGAIYGVEVADGVRALVLEHVDGDTLSARCPLPPAETVRVAVQIADALTAAHQAGVIHRDLKPANVKVTPDGVVKVLDFGLAKALATDADANAPTRLNDRTALGAVLGTTAYMSPEQTRGHVVDQRTDIWAFGCVLFEMLTGTRPFARETSSDTIAAILERDPPWDTLPSSTPAPIRLLLQRCLQKDAARRLSDMREAREILQAVASPRPRLRRRGWIAAGIATLVILAVLPYGRGLLGTLRQSPAPVSTPIRSVAVLPLVEVSARPGEDYFSAGMTGELITALSKIHAWRVISRTSVMQYKGTTKPLPAIAKELGVDALIEGSVQRSKDQVHITVRLVRAGPDENALWTQTYDRHLRDALDLQTEVAREITSRIQLTLTPTEADRLAVRRPIDPDVLDLYLRGREASELGTEVAIGQGIKDFESALKKDPKFAPAYAAMALAYQNLTPAYRAPRDVMPMARKYAEHAIAADDTLSEAHTALANVLFRYEWNWTATEREVRLAVDLNPSSADARELYGNYLVAVGEQARGIEQLILARDLNPSALTTETSLIGAYVTGRQYDEGIREARRMLDKDDTFAAAHAWLGMAYMMQKRFAEALAELQRARALDDNVTTTHFLAIAQAAAGNRASAEALIKDIEKAAASRYACAYEVAAVQLHLGRTMEAWKWMRKGEDEQCDCMVWLTTEPWMDPLRVDARYAELVKRVGPPAR